MALGTFITEFGPQNQIKLPSEVVNRLNLVEGDKVEILVKKIKSRKLDIKISKNPLGKLLDFEEGRK